MWKVALKKVLTFQTNTEPNFYVLFLIFYSKSQLQKFGGFVIKYISFDLELTSYVLKTVLGNGFKARDALNLSKFLKDILYLPI